MSWPKLRYPINTFGLSKEDAMILLAYDCIWRLKQDGGYLDSICLDYENQKEHKKEIENLDQDIDANLSNLGSHIETMICGGDMALRFEGYENLTAPIGVDIIPFGSNSGFVEIKEEQKEYNEAAQVGMPFGKVLK